MTINQRAMRKQVNAIFKSLGYKTRKHYCELAFGTLNGVAYTSNNLPGDLAWSGRSGFGQDFPLAEGDEIHFTIAWKECMYDTDEMDRVSDGNYWIWEPEIRIVDGQAQLAGV